MFDYDVVDVMFKHDELEVMSDDELYRSFRDVYNMISKARDPQEIQRLETEYCYLYRESEIRDNRRRFVEDNFGSYTSTSTESV